MAVLETDRMERSGRLTKSDITFISRHTHVRENIDIWKLFQRWDTWKKLIATGGGWLIYDIAYCKCSILFDLLLDHDFFCLKMVSAYLPERLLALLVLQMMTACHPNQQLVM
jgi:hypothetical protein